MFDEQWGLKKEESGIEGKCSKGREGQEGEKRGRRAEERGEEKKEERKERRAEKIGKKRERETDPLFHLVAVNSETH